MHWIVLGIQLAVSAVTGVFFYTMLRSQKRQEGGHGKNAAKEMEKLRKMRAVHLSEPLSEHVRPKSFSEIIGQEEGIRALQAILCGENPQHVIIYGPPGVGKTCAARLALEYAKKSPGTPFAPSAPFIEMDATCVRFDERAIADPLIGSVHDPIYQGAGPLGVQGVPQPMPGAVSRAHGGVLFLDEIGEMHPIQMNKLLKVLEDRMVHFESAYYHPDDHATPRYIHEIFQHGLPADFRLVGATTRSPEELPPALRSRCMEIFFRALDEKEISRIGKEAAERAGFSMDDGAVHALGRFAACGRDAVNMVQMAGGLSQLENRRDITEKDIQWVASCGRYAMKPEEKTDLHSRLGAVHGLAVTGSGEGAVMEIEAIALPGSGKAEVTGIVETEENTLGNRTLRRPSTARASADNVAAVLRSLGYLNGNTDVHINFPGGMPVDGPSAGAAMAAAAVSALTGKRIDGAAAVTGEISVQGHILPVGGVKEKIGAARRMGIQRVYIPKGCDQKQYHEDDGNFRVIPVSHICQVLEGLLIPLNHRQEDAASAPAVSSKAAAAAAVS